MPIVSPTSAKPRSGGVKRLGTVLANEEVIDGKSEVGGFPVARRPMRQWMLRITAYAERLLQDLDAIDWSHSLKEMQRNWIGRSEGADVTFALDAPGKPAADQHITVFTTRPDTLFGATYMVLAPEHPLVDAIVPDAWPDQTPTNWKGHAPEAAGTPRTAIAAYRAAAAAKSDRERTDLAKEKSGVFTGAYARNPANGELIPIWIADYVLLSYGTGAIMAVPAHDTRDLEFARAFGLPIRTVVQAPGGADSIGFVGDGISVDSGFITGLPTAEAKRKITQWLMDQALGRPRVNYKLRDWLFSRQRYWGEPFPILWKTGPDGVPYHEALPASELPVIPPPLDDFKPTSDGQPPLARAQDWVRLDGALRETNTMPQWAGSCWYYLRYLDPANPETFCDTTAERYWMGTEGPPDPIATRGVDLYVGGTEHAVLHLLYARFWHKVLFDLGHVSTPEPFHKLVNQGLILGEDGQKMSKSRGNVINPDDILKEYGADAFRLYEMFLGPLEMTKPWSTRGVEGVYRFLGRVWRLFVDESSETEFEQSCAADPQRAAEHLERIRPHPAIRSTGARNRAASRAARLHQESHGRPRSPALQYRHLRAHGVRQRGHDLVQPTRGNPPPVPDPAPALRTPSRGGTLANARCSHRCAPRDPWASGAVDPRLRSLAGLRSRPARRGNRGNPRPDQWKTP